MIPYGRQSINDDDIAAVVQALKGDFLTTGPLVEQFEQEIAQSGFTIQSQQAFFPGYAMWRVYALRKVK